MLFHQSQNTLFNFFIIRIYLQYHTVSQVIIGGLLGSVLGVLWFLFTQFILTPWFPTVASWLVFS